MFLESDSVRSCCLSKFEFGVFFRMISQTSPSFTLSAFDSFYFLAIQPGKVGELVPEENATTKRECASVRPGIGREGCGWEATNG